MKLRRLVDYGLGERGFYFLDKPKVAKTFFGASHNYFNEILHKVQNLLQNMLKFALYF